MKFEGFELQIPTLPQALFIMLHYIKSLIFTLILILLDLEVYSQTAYSELPKPVFSDSIQNVTQEPINRDLYFLPKNKEILEIESLTIKLDNISACLAILEVKFLDSIQQEIIFSRLEDFSEYFYQTHEPMIIVKNGLNSTEKTRKLKQENQIKNLKYISLGSSCLGNQFQEMGVDRFNKKTRLLISED
ncbi:hypothetical protein ACWA1C_13435 [Flectobacillus roseus]